MHGCRRFVVYHTHVTCLYVWRWFDVDFAYLTTTIYPRYIIIIMYLCRCVVYIVYLCICMCETAHIMVFGRTRNRKLAKVIVQCRPNFFGTSIDSLYHYYVRTLIAWYTRLYSNVHITDTYILRVKAILPSECTWAF